MEGKNRVVSYVVGTFLCFPLRVLHILPPLEKEPKTKPASKSDDLLTEQTVKSVALSQKGVKRTCGNAQKSVRMKHKK